MEENSPIVEKAYLLEEICANKPPEEAISKQRSSKRRSGILILPRTGLASARRGTSQVRRHD